jgi:hypothetical protein
MRALIIATTFLFSVLQFQLTEADTVSLPGSYQPSPADIMVLDSIVQDRMIVYDLGILIGNQTELNVRYGNLNALNTAFGDTVAGGSFYIYHNGELITGISDIADGSFDDISVDVTDLIDSEGMLDLQFALGVDSDAMAIYRPWLYITDDIPPAATEDLMVTRSFRYALKLEWTAPGDDGLEGTASMYEIRFSKWPVEEIEEWWGYAEQVRDLPYPDQPGSPEAFIVTDLDTVSTYYFALVTYDEMGNRSGYSNIASGTTGEDNAPETNYCLRYNGQNSRCVVPFQEVLNPGQNITIEAWIYPYVVSGTTQRMILDKPYYSWSNPFYQYNMAVNEERTLFTCITTGGSVHCLEDGTGLVPLNEWTHIAVTYDGSSFNNYINGVPNETAYISGYITGYETDLSIGIRGGADLGFWNGLIDEIRLWDISRTREEIEETMHYLLDGSEPGLAAYWTFDEGEGQLFFDMTGQGSDGYLGFGPDQEESDPLWVESDAPIEYRRTDNYQDSSPATPVSFALSQNYPNPFNATTNISFELPRRDHIRIEIFDMLGRKVRTLTDDAYEAGSHQISWDGTSDTGESSSSGLYFYSLKSSEFEQTRKMLMLK